MSLDQTRDFADVGLLKTLFTCI